MDNTTMKGAAHIRVEEPTQDQRRTEKGTGRLPGEADQLTYPAEADHQINQSKSDPNVEASSLPIRMPLQNKRQISINVCSSSPEFNVEGLLEFLQALKRDRSDLIKEIKFHRLPYDIDRYRLPHETAMDVFILCHSIFNRRFAITNVPDALYDKFLLYCHHVIGKQKMAVIVHDFNDVSDAVNAGRMATFRRQQPTTFSTTSLALTCGSLEKTVEMIPSDTERLVSFFERAGQQPATANIGSSSAQQPATMKIGSPSAQQPARMKIGSSSTQQPATMMIRSPSAQQPATMMIGSSSAQIAGVMKMGSTHELTTVFYGGTSSSCGNYPSPGSPREQPCLYPTGEVNQALLQSRGVITKPSTATSLGRADPVLLPGEHGQPRPISVFICTSSYEHNVKGMLSLIEKFRDDHKDLIYDVRLRKLPYNNIDTFKFPPHDPVDVMILCHSVHNRGFAITDVSNALYDKYLKYCHEVIGKRKVAVVVHDFSGFNPSSHEAKMCSFVQSQSSTFALVDTVILCGRLDDTAVEMRDQDKEKLLVFLKTASREPRANNRQQSVVKAKLSQAKKSFSDITW